MKSYLKGADNLLYQLSPKLTTVGKDGCDINLQTQGLDQQHAVIEFNDSEDCFVLQDLNTAQGTYVNDCRIQNAVVRLAPGDVIKFGYTGVPHELIVENPPPEHSYATSSGQLTYRINERENKIAYPPVQQRPAWTQPLTLLTETLGYTQSSQTQQTHQTHQHHQGYNPAASLPYLQTATATITIPSTVWTPAAEKSSTVPRPPPSLRSRPLSAGSVRRVGALDRVQTIGGSPVMSPVMQRSMTNGWMGNTNTRVQQTNSNVDIAVIQEKEQKIMQLTEEVNRLRNLEIESFRKDAHIQTLQQTMIELQQKLGQQQPLIMGQDVDLHEKLVKLENEVTAKTQELAALKEQLLLLQNGQQQTSSVSLTDDKSQEILSLKNELERIKKDKNITSGLVTQMQKDMSNKDTTISKLTREIETLKKEIREREIQITSLSNKLSKSKESPLKSTEERDAREKELISLRQKFKTAEGKVQEQQDLITSLRQEIEKIKLTVFEEKSSQKKLQLDVDTAKAELLDVQRAERVVRVDLEQASKRLERFRNRVIQTTFSTPGIKAPDTEIHDDELLETLKKIVDERTEFQRKFKDVEEQLKLTDSSSNVFKRNISKLRNELEQVVTHLKSNGFHASAIKHEISLLQSVTGDESLVWMRDCLINLLNNNLAWEQGIEAALESCGVNVKLSNDEPGKHIQLLFAKWETAIGDNERLQAQISNMKQQFKADLEMQIKVIKEDGDNKVTDALEKARIEAEEKLNKAIEEIKTIEAEKCEIAVTSERQKMEELQGIIDQLKQNLSEKQTADSAKLQEAEAALSQLEEYKALELELNEKIKVLEMEKGDLDQKIESEINGRDQKYEQDVEAYKEQNKQHSVTICAMEERLIKLMKKNKDYQEEITTLKKTIQEMKAEILDLKNKPLTKPVPPPKPKVIMQPPSEDFVAMEQLIVVLRKENSELKNKIQSQDDLILGLRRDLAGAHARLSDITGELSESQKREIEQNKEKLNQREKEVTELRQQMAKLSKIIDKQKNEIKSLEVELSKEKAITVKYKATLDEKNTRIRDLEILLEQEKEEQRKQIDVLDQEGRITSELTAMGAQCRGERHEQVISRQREALAELRARVKVLEQSKPPLPTQDQALQQVIMLKKELAEMKANQALSDDSGLYSGVEREVSRARGLLGSVNAEADMERSAHRETMDALDASESSYLTLLRAMASCLELESVDGLRPIGHIPKDEREKLLQERENSCQVLANRIKVFRDRIARKEELLQGYERDLAKMRQAQELADRKTTQVDSLANDVKSRTEETQYLRESLNRARDRLDQEKRLNKAIKQRKTYHLENERLHQQMRPSSHRCKPEDQMGQALAKKKMSKDALKRKTYEINTLKKELCQKEQMLYDTENRLYTIENSARNDRQREAEVIES